MSKTTILFVGLDVHKDSMEIVAADGTQGRQARSLDRIGAAPSFGMHRRRIGRNSCRRGSLDRSGE